MGLQDERAAKTVGSAEVIVQATPVGGEAEPHGAPIPALWLPARAALLDVVYQPLPTPLMRAVVARGGTAIGGDRMFLHQADAQFLFWTGRSAPFAVLENAFYEKEES